MRNLIPFLLTALIYTNTDVLQAVKEVPTNGKVEQKIEEPKTLVEDVTPPTACEQEGTIVDGAGHQEVRICPDGASGIRDMQVTKGMKRVRWKGNPNVGYYRLRDDGSIDSSYWRSSLTGGLA